MLMDRNVFSSSFTSSAASGDDTGTSVSNTGSYSASVTRRQASVTPPTTLGVLRVCHRRLPGSTRSGLKARKTSDPTRSPRTSIRGRSSSRVVPG
jgi:hypothetical protein